MVQNQVSVDVSDYKIDSVQVFYERSLALVHRFVQVDLKVGDNEVTLNTLPNNVVEDSIRLESVESGFVVDITSVNFNKGFGYSALVKSSAQAEVDELAGQMNENSREISTYQDIENKLRKGLKEDANVTDLQEWLDVYAEKRKEHSSKIADLKAKNEVLSAAIDKKVEESKLDSTVQTKTEITALVKSDEDCRVALELTYMVPASWTPMYEMHVDPSGKSSHFRLAYRAQVSQLTGEDWNDVVLTLATGGSGRKNTSFLPTYCPPLNSVTRPILYSQMNGSVDCILPAPTGHPLLIAPPAISPRPLSINPCWADCMAMSSPFTGGALGNGVSYNSTIPETGDVHKFVLEGRVTVKDETCKTQICPGISQHKKSVYSIIDIDLPLNLQWNVNFIGGSFAHVRCQIDNVSPHPLLEGYAKLFIDNVYNTTFDLPAALPGEKTPLIHLFDDSDVKVTYDRVKHTDFTSMWRRFRRSGTRTMHREHNVTVENLGKRAIGPIFVPAHGSSVLAKSKVIEPAGLPPPSDPEEIEVRPGVTARWETRNTTKEAQSGVVFAKTNSLPAYSNAVEFVVKNVDAGAKVDLRTTWCLSAHRSHFPVSTLLKGAGRHTCK